MKKFLIFLVSIVVVVCLGLTTYYFLRNDETINFKTKEIYCNAGDVITLKQLGYERVKADKDTKINYNAGGDEVTKYVKYDEDKGYYVVGENGGDVSLVIKTSNKKFPEFKVTIHIGNGSETSPYYIDDEASLTKIGQTYGLDKFYVLRNDINVSNGFKTIGYNFETEKWEGFSGKFDGNGFAISGLKLSPTDTEEVGLFSTINSGAVVEDLTVKNARVEGEFDNAGILAGKIDGSVSKIRVEDSEIICSKENANVGAVAGYIGNVALTTSYAKNVTISANGANANVGGFAGVADKTLIQACYASKINVTANEVSSVGGFVGSFVIGTEQGSIQQSYANVTCANANFGAFVGAINQDSNFDVNTATMLRYLVGNKAVSVNGNVVTTVNVANKADGNAFFSAFEDKTNAYYLITNYVSETDLIAATDLVFYALDPSDAAKVQWDSNVWENSSTMLPQLKMSSLSPEGVSNAYIQRNLSKQYISSVYDLATADGKEFILLNDITLPSDWESVNVTNSVIDGNGKTITFADGGNKSVFDLVMDSTIKNLNLANVKVNASSRGALANSIDSTDAAFASTIENVHVTYVGETDGADLFGGLVGVATKSNINNCSVSGLNYVGNANKVGGIVNQLYQSTLTNCSVNAVLSGKEWVAGVAANNVESTISNVTGIAVINQTTNAENTVLLGGVASQNSGLIADVNLNVKINIQSATLEVRAGGVVAENFGTIQTTTISGEGIVVGEAIESNVILGGAAAYNANLISNTNIFITQVGTYREGKNDVVGGVAAYNSGASSQIVNVVASADVYGNVVAGAVVYMNESTSAVVNQVLIAKFNKDTDEISANTIKGDKYVAGVSFDFRAGVITNVQAVSNIIGGTNTTRSSLALLIFPDGASFTNSTIDSSFEGNGVFYMDTWNNFYETPTIEGNFAVVESDRRFNLYGSDAHSGSFQSVVINTEKAYSKGVYIISSSKFTTAGNIYSFVDYQDTEESSFYKTTTNGGFADVNTFKQDWYVDVTNGGFFGSWWNLGWGNPEFSRSMTFDIGNTWAEGVGIRLAFLANV